MSCEWSDKIFNVTVQNFTDLALQIFHFQYRNNPVYKAFVDHLSVDVAAVKDIIEIPFLPIRFFKSHSIMTTCFDPQVIFESSGTTQTINSRHLVKDKTIYEESFLKAFPKSYGAVEDWCILGLLPSYLQRKNSSLVYMVDKLITSSHNHSSGFYLYNLDELYKQLQTLEAARQQTLLIGVTFALLDFIEKYPLALKHTTVMETGGMKGRRREMIREELHEVLCKGFGVKTIHSEYGMTELLSQAYSKGDGIFECPPWMKVLVRDEDDPLTVKENGKGVLNVVDLANIYSCSFIATDDAGNIFDNGNFEVLGRTDGSDLRGCSLMAV
jgi:phenylacetate-coenzyme A ligase PaaK-like adenylate-forming protein